MNAIIELNVVDIKYTVIGKLNHVIYAKNSILQPYMYNNIT